MIGRHGSGRYHWCAVSKQTRQKNLRLFVAVYPPAECAAALVRLLDHVELPAHRLVPVEQVHLTLQFIGDTPPQKLEAVIETVQRATGGLGAFELTFLRLMTLPPRRPRLVAAETDAPAALLELHRRLVTRLAHAARRNPADRFRPHLTLCRFRAPSRMASLDHPLELEPFSVGRIVLMRSTLTSEGAQHREAASIPLTGR